MESLFRFWGYTQGDHQRLVGAPGSGRPIVVAAAPLPSGGGRELRLGKVVFSDGALALLGPLARFAEGGILAYVAGQAPSPRDGGEALARLEALDGADLGPLVTRDGAGAVTFWFDVEESLRWVEQERYLTRRAPFYGKLGLSPEYFPAVVRKIVVNGFKLSKTLLERSPIGQRAAVFPERQKDFSVDVWRYLVRGLVERLGGPAAVPLWPDGKRYAVALNHDVDTEWGFRNARGIESFRRAEEERGVRSSWMVVARLHGEGKSELDRMRAAGQEIGYHGTTHDHMVAYRPQAAIAAWIDRAAPFLREYDCVGYRAPSYHHTDALYRALDGASLAYDMSMHDSFENVNSPVPSFEGCSTCFPFRLEGTNLLEIPTTVTEDFVLELSGVAPERALEIQWSLVERLRERQGVANILTHPEPQLSARPEWIQVYERLLDRLVADPAAWIPTPRELCAWWKARAARIASTWAA